MADKKQDDRIHHRIPVQLLVDFQCDGNYLFDFCEDLGTGGIFIQTANPLEVGTTIDLTFTLPDSKKTIQTKGRVIWAQPQTEGTERSPGMGVQFENFDSEQRALVLEFLQRHTPPEQSKKPA